ncbi:hypothetical protein T01_3844 [Trichinella spiralis]|uniref:Uncharacterized protein n=1 Tax=Trichinella spiralis TaxID=6334 RepID=A0A0V1BMF2_TRISP|nr:hypothetical protein T01_3844 [Trichinella spiralis]
MSRQSVRVPIWLTTPSDTNPYALPKVANARLVMVSQLWSDWSSVIPHLDDKHVQCERAYFSSNGKLNHSLTSLGKFDQAPDEHCTVIVHIPPHRAFAVKSNSRVGSIVTFDVFTNYDIVNGECQNWKRKTTCYLFMKQLKVGTLTIVSNRAQQEKSSDYAASKDNSIFRRLADYCGGKRPFSSSLTIARQLRAKVFGSGQRKISTRTQFVPCSCSADPSFDGRFSCMRTNRQGQFAFQISPAYYTKRLLNVREKKPSKQARRHFVCQIDERQITWGDGQTAKSAKVNMQKMLFCANLTLLNLLALFPIANFNRID